VVIIHYRVIVDIIIRNICIIRVRFLYDGGERVNADNEAGIDITVVAIIVVVINIVVGVLICLLSNGGVRVIVYGVGITVIYRVCAGTILVTVVTVLFTIGSLFVLLFVIIVLSGFIFCMMEVSGLMLTTKLGLILLL